MLLALLLRGFIAGVYLPQSGFRIDIVDFTAWAQRLARGGPGAFYATDYFSDYPPGYLYVLWVLGKLGAALTGVVGQDATAGLVKIPGILSDLGVAGLLFALSRRFLDGRFGRSGETIGLVAATIYLFNPGTIFDSSVWGQVDSVGTLVVLATIYFLGRGWTEVAAVGAVVALLVKFQFGFLIPVVAVVGLRRHLLGRSSDLALDGRPDPLRVLTSLAAGFGSLTLLILPFGLTLWSPDPAVPSLVGKVAEAAGTYTGLSINAFNLWRNPFSGLGSAVAWGCDVAAGPGGEGCAGGVAFTLGGLVVSWQLVGTVLFAAAAVVALWQIARRDDVPGVLLGTLVLAVAFFVLPTRVHERYLFPALALAAPFVLRNWRWAALYGVLSLSFFMNVYWAYTIDWSYAGPEILNPGVGGKPMARDPLLASSLLTDWGVYLLSFMIVLALGWLISRALAVARRPSDERVGETALHAAAAPGEPAEAESPEAPEPTEDRLPAPRGEWRPAGFGWLRSTRSDPLLREPMRRFDRLDALLVVVFVLGAFVFRLWRLDLPQSMHFDEVYHARSATEWLADWEHGWKRDAYEWTHPMLAKYLIAAGIEIADPNKVTATVPLDGAPAAIAVAPKRAAHGHQRSVIFLADGTDRIVARDALNGEQVASWTAGTAVSALAYDAEGERLLAGSTASGSVLVYPLSAFLSHVGPRAPPPSAPPIETGLDSVSQIAVHWRADLSVTAPPQDDVLLFGGTSGIAEVDRASGNVLAIQRPAERGTGLCRGDLRRGPAPLGARGRSGPRPRRRARRRHAQGDTNHRAARRAGGAAHRPRRRHRPAGVDPGRAAPR